MPYARRQSFAAGRQEVAALGTALTISVQTTHMSIRPTSNFLLPLYGPLAGNSPPAAKSASPVQEAAEQTSREAVIPATGLGSPTSGRDARAADSNGEPDGNVESSLERALRQGRVASGNSTGEESNFTGARYAPAIGLYRRVSQYGDSGPSVSSLMKSWNDIVSQTQLEDADVVSHVKAVAQNDSLGLQSGILHLTA